MSDKATVKAKLKDLELRREAAAAEKAEIELATAKLAYEADRHAHEYTTMQQASRTGIFRLDEPVDQSSTGYLIQQFRRYAATHPGDGIELILSTPGGSVIDGLALFDEIRALSEAGHHITTRVRGYAASMGAILLQAGDTRIVGPESYVMVHEVSAGTFGKLHEMSDSVKFFERLNDRLFDMIVRRSGGKLTKTRLNNLAKKTDWWLTADEAVNKYGLADLIG